MQVLVAVDGSGVVEAPGAQPVSFNRGESVIIPASSAGVYRAPAVVGRVSANAVPSEKVAAAKNDVVIERLASEEILDPEFLSRHPRRWTWYSLLATEPKKLAKQLLPLNTQKNIDPGDGRGACSLAPSKQCWIITNADLRETSAASQEDAEAAGHR